MKFVKFVKFVNDNCQIFCSAVHSAFRDTSKVVLVTSAFLSLCLSNELGGFLVLGVNIGVFRQIGPVLVGTLINRMCNMSTEDIRFVVPVLYSRLSSLNINLIIEEKSYGAIVWI